MTTFEYKVVASPRKSKAPRKVKGPEAKFAATLGDVINEMAAEGWEYQRAETLPSDERQGLTGKTVKYHSVLVFRRAVEAAVEDQPVADIEQTPAPAYSEPQRDEPVLTRPEVEAEAEGPASEGFMDDSPMASSSRETTE